MKKKKQFIMRVAPSFGRSCWSCQSCLYFFFKILS